MRGEKKNARPFGIKTWQYRPGLISTAIFLIFTVPRGDVSIGPKQDVRHPGWNPGHLFAELIQGDFFFALDDHFVMDMPADEAM